MGASNKDRQAAFKDRMRQEGRVMKTLWLDVDQERAVKALLSGQSLPVTVIPEQEPQQAREADRVTELEAEVALLTQQLAVARDLEQKANQECITLLEKHRLAARDMERLSKELKAARKEGRKDALKGFNLSAPRAEERAKVLLDKIDQMTTWRGETKSRDAYGTRQAAEHLANLVRQTKAARTAIAKAEAELADVVSDGEKGVLTYARMALSQILEAAEIAKDHGRGIAKKREDHENACEAAAEKAVSETFQPESIEDQIVLVMAPGKPESYTHAADLLNGKAFCRTGRGPWGKEIPVDILATTIASAVREATVSLVYKVQHAIQAPTEAVLRAQDIRAEMETRRAVLLIEHGELIQRIKAELVLRRMENAAAVQPDEAKVC